MPIIDMKKVIAVCSAIGFIITIGGSYIAVDSRYAKAEDVKKVEIRLEQKILEDRSQALQDRAWKLEDRYGVSIPLDGPPAIKEQYRQILQEKQVTDKKIEVIQQKVSK